MPELGDPISERELDVLNCLAEGASNREIAKQLSISPNTVKVHIRNIYTKLGVSSRTEATTVALQKGVLTIPGVEVGVQEEADGEPEEEIDGDRPVTPPVPEVEGAMAEPAGNNRHVQEEVGELQVTTGDTPATTSGRSTSRVFTVLFGIIAVVALVLAALSLFDILGEAASNAEPSATPDLFQETEVGENWLMSRPLPEPRAHMVVSAIGLNLYAIGGETAEGVDNSVLIYDTQQRQWSSGAPKLTAVADAAAQVLAGEIYVVGGRLENGQATNAVEAYSPLNNGWRPLTSLPQPIAGALALTFGNQLYLFGGENNEEVLDSAYVYDPAARQWHTLPSLRQARAFAAGGVLDGYLYVVGGSDGQKALASCERFDPLAEEWSTCPDLQEARMGAGAAAFLDKLYVLGGASEEGVTVNEVYESGAEAWSGFAAPQLEAGEEWSHLGVINVETRIYALGGNRQEQLSDETLIYRPVVYTFFIPAASAGEE